MANKKHNSSKYIFFPANYFEEGGTNKNSGQSVTKTMDGLSGVFGSFTRNAKIADTNDFEEQLRASSNRIIKPLDNDALMQEYDTWNPYALTNRKQVRGSTVGQRIGNTLESAGSGASMGASIGGAAGGIGALPGAAIGALAGLAAGISAWGTGDMLAHRKSKQLNKMITFGNERRLQSLDNAAQNLDRTQDLQMQSAFYRDGGKLNFMSNGGHTNGAIWDNGITHFNEGGTHSENPFGGIIIGTDNKGTPNLVEEGEVRWKDMILSNKLKPNVKYLEAVGLNKKYKDKTFAEISKILGKESEERPNDPISKRGLDVDMNKLAIIQEEMRSKKEQRKQSKGNVFDLGTEDLKNPLDFKRNIINPYAAFNNNTARKKQPWEIAAEIASKSLAETSKSAPKNITSPPGNKYGSIEQNAHLLRYAPAVGNAVMSLTDMLGLTNKPDNSIAQMLNNTPEVPFNPVGNYLTYNPLDINYHRNNLLAQTSATRRALMSDVSPSKGANIIAADYNANMAMGNLARQAEEYNLAQRAKVEEFNRGTNMFNSEGVMKAAQANAELKLKTKLAQAELMNVNKERSASAKSTNLSNLFESLSGIGREQTFLNSIKSDNTLYYERLPDGTIRYKNAYHSLSPKEKEIVDAQIKIEK